MHTYFVNIIEYRLRYIVRSKKNSSVKDLMFCIKFFCENSQKTLAIHILIFFLLLFVDFISV